ncbi:hypothetical protein [Amycolatopsis regifaucium]|nr:hypothetical protein [Amycolatopsis regifaucium]SFH50194.1 hypothetical protein SAMN04489731_104504 [Amycolatopsis regifaucium]
MTSSALSLAGTDREVRDAALRYWCDFGWPVRTTHTDVLLSLQRDLLAVAMSATRGGPLLDRMDSAGVRGGVVGLRGGDGEQWWAFLITPPERPVPRAAGVWLFNEGTDLPLPQGAAPANGVRWIREPIPGGALFDGDLLFDATAG